MKKIAIIGGGNIGSRHLQGVAALDEAVEIFVVEPSKDAIGIAKNRFAEITTSGNHRLTFYNNIKDLPAKLDIGIVATSSAVRREVIENLLEHSEVEFLILEKFMFTRNSDFTAVARLLEEKGVKAYVDCGRRAMDTYKELKEALKDASYIDMTVTGGEWGLACNGIHMLDLYAFLTEGGEFEFDNNLLDKRIYESKRHGYIEFGGQMTLKCKRGTLSMGSYFGGGNKDSFCLQSDVIDVIIYESQKTMVVIETG